MAENTVITVCQHQRAFHHEIWLVFRNYIFAKGNKNYIFQPFVFIFYLTP